jgi:hypothetical protein
MATNSVAKNQELEWRTKQSRPIWRYWCTRSQMTTLVWAGLWWALMASHCFGDAELSGSVGGGKFSSWNLCALSFQEIINSHQDTARQIAIKLIQTPWLSIYYATWLRVTYIRKVFGSSTKGHWLTWRNPTLFGLLSLFLRNKNFTSPCCLCRSTFLCIPLIVFVRKLMRSPCCLCIPAIVAAP